MSLLLSLFRMISHPLQCQTQTLDKLYQKKNNTISDNLCPMVLIVNELTIMILQTAVICAHHFSLGGVGGGAGREVFVEMLCSIMT